MTEKRETKTKERHFTVQWPFVTGNGCRVTPVGGLFSTSDPKLISACARAMGAVEITAEEVAARKTKALAGTRGGGGTVEVIREPAPEPAQPEPPQPEATLDEDIVTADQIEHMTKREMTELLTGWGEEFPKRANAAKLRELALAGLEAELGEDPEAEDAEEDESEPEPEAEDVEVPAEPVEADVG